MGFDDYLAVAVTGVIRHSPILVIGILGLWYALPMRQQFARAAGWASLGFTLLIVHSILGVTRDVASVVIRVNFAFEPTEIGLALSFLALVAYVPLLGALLLLARAVFLDRGIARATLQDSDSVGGGNAA